MSQVIVYQNPNGTNVCVCYPSGELPIEEILARDCPSDAFIIDDSALPQGSGAQFFDAWVLNGTTVSVNFPTAQSEKLNQYNSAALVVANRRNLNTIAGLPNYPDDATWSAELKAGRDAIAVATTTDELVAIPNPS
jgi:hypothetical protein